MCIYRGCTCPKCTNKARMHQQSKDAPTKQGCTNKAAHAAWIEDEQAAVERSGSHLCKCTHNKRITAIISFLLFVILREFAKFAYI